MSAPLYLGVFENETDVINATRATRDRGYPVYDVYTPYAVHGLDEAMGLAPSRLTWVCFAVALAGFLVATVAQFWIESIDWPLNVGGKPFNSLPAYLPVMFETTVLVGGLGTVLALLVRTRMYPGKPARVVHPDATNHRFVLAVEHKDSSFNASELTRLWEDHHVVETRYAEEQG